MSVTIQFMNYPGRDRSGSPTRYRGTMEAKSSQGFVVPLAEPTARVWPQRPLQGQVRWQIVATTVDGDWDGRIDDLHRWLRGIFWTRMPGLLFAEFLDNRGLEDLARVYRRLALGK